MVKAKQYIEGNYQQTCSLQTVAAYVHVTPNYFSNLFKKETGISFTHYVSQLRIWKRNKYENFILRYYSCHYFWSLLCSREKMY
ncbi:AraC family transcriptional regulator [Paenibacillus macerans]|uniref:Bacterial regulatory helix-turn-helix s, AraC family protein n=1 Tax=Paenibacillus macerans TaxID=44252 RepID=A0A090ZDA3_PAEMA|nr:AraC family transcriptional regulator [Paenibacillus macerans]KFN08190.1 bacterial regulatory helix-turn-helix s, AraC family protein [Paenibacillus macerans]SUA83619.1 AraC family transcriptional regulator [Paenibacillus macerans]GBK66002.1 hypothetical protein PbDSM24746_60060 [Paenibacillus macerans]GBK72331.1 hypothetical protein PbJCM17693_60390 [Paenibacillus macerans]GIP12442.1 hypothetical protein J1TS5_46120 [Paenibacillus macerans]